MSFCNVFQLLFTARKKTWWNSSKNRTAWPDKFICCSKCFTCFPFFSKNLRLSGRFCLCTLCLWFRPQKCQQKAARHQWRFASGNWDREREQQAYLHGELNLNCPDWGFMSCVCVLLGRVALSLCALVAGRQCWIHRIMVPCLCYSSARSRCQRPQRPPRFGRPPDLTQKGDAPSLRPE